jgi:uncharacterized membrane protein
MTQAVQYQYVAGPVEDVGRAWRSYEVARRGKEPHRAVHFVPAAGGCFVVALLEDHPKTALSLATAVRLLAPSPETAVRRDLQRFKAEFENTRRALTRRPRIVTASARLPAARPQASAP